MQLPSTIGPLPALPSVSDWGKSASGFTDALSHYFSGGSKTAVTASTENGGDNAPAAVNQADTANESVQANADAEAEPVQLKPLPEPKPYDKSSLIIGAVPIPAGSPLAHIESSEQSAQAASQFIEKIRASRKSSRFTTYAPQPKNSIVTWKDIAGALANKTFHLTDRNGRGVMIRDVFGKALVKGYRDEFAGEKIDPETGIPQLAADLHGLGPTLTVDKLKFNLNDLYQDIFKDEWKQAMPVLHNRTAALTEPRMYQKHFNNLFSKMLSGFADKDVKPGTGDEWPILHRLWFTQTVNSLRYSDPFNLDSRGGLVDQKKHAANLEKLAASLTFVPPDASQTKVKTVYAPLLVILGHKNEDIAKIVDTGTGTVTSWSNNLRGYIQGMITDPKPPYLDGNVIQLDRIEGGANFKQGDFIYEVNDKTTQRYVTRDVMKDIFAIGGTEAYDVVQYRGWRVGADDEIELFALPPFGKTKPDELDLTSNVVKIESPDGANFYVKPQDVYNALLTGQFSPESKYVAVQAGFTSKELNELPATEELSKLIPQLEKYEEQPEGARLPFGYVPPLEKPEDPRSSHMFPRPSP
jgi:hypothetical protein